MSVLESSVDFNAVLLDQEDIKKLNVLLAPPDPLDRDVRSVAGHLDFTTDEVRYLTVKPYPFVYMYDQWLKRDGRNATLQKLHATLFEIGRHDAAEIVEKALKAINDKDPKEVMKLEERFFSTLQRSISSRTLYGTACESDQLQNEQLHNNHSRIIPVPRLLKQSKCVKEDDSAPDVFVVYFPEDEQHIRNVAAFVKKLRKKGIDATCDMFESQADNDRGFYMYSKLVESEYVFVVCSKTFYQYSQTNLFESMDTKAKDVSFIMKMILREIYDSGGINAKFVPVLFAHGTEAIIPSFLKCATTYKMPQDFDNLRRRVFKEEKYKLAPMPSKRPKIAPKVIGGGNGLLNFCK